MTEAEIAWAAGLFEGEGCFSVYQNRSRRLPNIKLQLGMTDRDVVDRFADLMQAGSIQTKERHPNKTIYIWSISSKDEVARIVQTLYPYLGERRKTRADEVLAACAEGKRQGGTHCYRGHELAPDNLIRQRGNTGNQLWRCKTCKQINRRRHYEKELAIRRRDQLPLAGLEPERRPT